MWKSYMDIMKLDERFQHFMMNHSLHFVEPKTGVQSNNIESTWKTCKMKQMCGKNISFYIIIIFLPYTLAFNPMGLYQKIRLFGFFFLIQLHGVVMSDLLFYLNIFLQILIFTKFVLIVFIIYVSLAELIFGQFGQKVNLVNFKNRNDNLF